MAIAFYTDDHIGPCSHTGLVTFIKYNQINNTLKILDKSEIETNNCIKSIDSNPRLPYIFVMGSFSGEIYLIDFSSGDKDSIKYISKIDSYFHKESVNVVKFVMNEEGKYVRNFNFRMLLLYQRKEDY